MDKYSSTNFAIDIVGAEATLICYCAYKLPISGCDEKSLFQSIFIFIVSCEITFVKGIQAVRIDFFFFKY